MFSELVESVARPSSWRKKWAVILSATLQGTLLLVLVLIPLIYTQALPKVILGRVLVTVMGAPSQPTPQTPPAKGRTPSVRLLHNGVLMEPPRIPRTVNIIQESPLPPEEPAEPGTIAGSSGLDLLRMAPAPTESMSPPPALPRPPQRVPVTSTIEAAKLISRIQPVYPALAIQARIQGNVVLHAIISKERNVSELQVLSGHPLLVNAALQVVRQWRYSATLLNGQAVEVETTITVSFVLGQ